MKEEKLKSHNYFELSFKIEIFVAVCVDRTDTNLSKLETPFEVVLLFGTCVMHTNE